MTFDRVNKDKEDHVANLRLAVNSLAKLRYSAPILPIPLNTACLYCGIDLRSSLHVDNIICCRYCGQHYG